MVHRFFVSPDAISGDEVTFDPPTAHQLRNVLRLRPGEQVRVLDNSGAELTVTLTALERDVGRGRVCERRKPQTEPLVSLTLYQCLLKGDRFEWVLQKGTELGVSRFVPVSSERTVMRISHRRESKHARWARIIREAAEQSHRARLPALSGPLSFPEACEESIAHHDMVLLPWEEASGEGLPAALAARAPILGSVALVLGPEGGFSSSEVSVAQSHGIRVVTLGPRILRAETASVAASAVLLALLGEMG